MQLHVVSPVSRSLYIFFRMTNMSGETRPGRVRFLDDEFIYIVSENMTKSIIWFDKS